MLVVFSNIFLTFQLVYKARFPLPELTGGPSTRLVETRARQLSGNRA